MKNTKSSSQLVYEPQKFKTFEGALEGFLATECPQLGGSRTRQVLVKCISDIVRAFFPKTSHLRQGQVIWTTVHKNEKSSYGKSIRQTKLKSVILDLVRPEDAEDLSNGKTINELRKESVPRLCKQAYDQGGCLTHAELSILLKLAPRTIGEYIAEWENKNGEPLPRRGTIHDIGPTLTHKKMIIKKLFIEQKPVEQVCRETHHSPQAVQRYIGAFKQILLCKKKGMTTEEISFAVRMTKGLVKEYEEILNDFRRRNGKIDEIISYKEEGDTKC